jgi:ornithine decarboxylase
MLTTGKFIISKKKVIEQYNIVKNMSDIISFSFKTNNDVGSILEEKTDCFFTIHSIKSVEKIKDKKRIWFYGQAWNEEELKLLFSYDIKNYIVDNEKDLNKLTDYIESDYKDEKKVSILLRMRLKENTVHTGKHFVFGMYSNQIKEIIPKLKEKKYIDKLGIHFHRKTQNTSEWSLKYELSSLYSEELLKIIDIVNIGGGIPIKYKNFRTEIINNIFERINELKDWLNSFDIKMMIEPGRFISGPSGILETEIMNIYDNNIIVNCSVFNSYMDTYIADLRLIVEDELEEGKGNMYTIKGCTPDSADIFRYRVFLSEKKVGDKIRFINAGAYNFYTEFCSLPKPEVIIID